MTKLPSLMVGTAALVAVSNSGTALAAPSVRVQVDQHGDFLLIGNTLGYDCADEPPAPTVGTIESTACAQLASYLSDSAPDAFWRSDEPSPGQALADKSYTAADARTTAMLVVPDGARITHAYLYWAAKEASGVVGTSIMLDRPGTAGFQQAVNAMQSYQLPSVNTYQSVANVTNIVQQYGAGAYRVAGIATSPFANVDDNTRFAAWLLVAFYELSSDPLRNLTLFDGLDVVSSGNNQSVELKGFVVPNAGYDGKLGVIAYEGDAQLSGDMLFFNGGQALFDNQNPPDNFFNSTRSWLGQAKSVSGDLPQLKGTSRSMAGVDFDVVDIKPRLTPGQTSAVVEAKTDNDQYYLGAFITSITTLRPDFSTSTKTVVDVNGGALLAGETLEYTLLLKNTGNDGAVKTVVSDPLPAGVTYVPGSLRVVSGANAGTKTDQAGDDQAEYDAVSRSVIVRIGAAADAVQGGTIPMNESAVVSFRVTVNPGVTGRISNQASIAATGASDETKSTTTTVTDGNGLEAGVPPTDIIVDACETDTQCSGATPVCKASVSPKVCVSCVIDSHCGGLASGKVCNESDKCIDGCRGTGGNGCAAGNVCTSKDNTIGACYGCLVDSDCGSATSGKVCNATHTCIDGCRGTGGNGCASPATCSSSDASIGQCFVCVQDSTCGGPNSGKVCDLSTHQCTDGCRGTGGNGCPQDEVCSSVDGIVGRCTLGDGGMDGGDGAADAHSDAADGSDGTAGTDAGGSGRGWGFAGSRDAGVDASADVLGTGGSAPYDWSEIVAQGNGLSCNTAPGASRRGLGWLVGAALAACATWRRRVRGDAHQKRA